VEKHKAKEQLLNELAEMSQRTAELEAVDTERKRAEEALERRALQLQTAAEGYGCILDRR
jgi:hypothetical protein